MTTTLDEAPSAGLPTWMLVAGAPRDVGGAPAPRLSKRLVLLAVARRGLPRLLEATLVPAALFIVVIHLMGPLAAMLAVLIWGYGAILRRVLRGEAIPAILMLATLGLTVKTAVGLASGSTFAYFIQPVATTVVLALVFFGSLLVGRPAIAHLAHDFCPLGPDVASRPPIARLFRGLTVLWATVHLVTALSTFVMLISMPVALFVALKTVASFGISGAAIVITVVWALRIAHEEELVFAIA
ncbi:MAG TPA: VC0807 family protein [Acidimicrobiia bacterium]|nr:VC0807 family protein [Acidimicrobiia bacterium]